MPSLSSGVMSRKSKQRGKGSYIHPLPQASVPISSEISGACQQFVMLQRCLQEDEVILNINCTSSHCTAGKPSSPRLFSSLQWQTRCLFPWLYFETFLEFLSCVSGSFGKWIAIAFPNSTSFKPATAIFTEIYFPKFLSVLATLRNPMKCLFQNFWKAPNWGSLP